MAIQIIYPTIFMSRLTSPRAQILRGLPRDAAHRYTRSNPLLSRCTLGTTEVPITCRPLPVLAIQIFFLQDHPDGFAARPLKIKSLNRTIDICENSSSVHGRQRASIDRRRKRGHLGSPLLPEDTKTSTVRLNVTSKSHGGTRNKV